MRCSFCRDQTTPSEYRDLSRYLHPDGRIRRRVSRKTGRPTKETTGLCSLHHRQMTRAVKRARELALLEAARTISKPWDVWDREHRKKGKRARDLRKS